MEPSVLVAAPIAKAKEYVIHRWFEWIQRLTYPLKDFYFVDNSDDPDWHKALEDRYGFRIDYYPPKGRKHAHILADCQNHIANYVIANGYSHLMMIECDVFPPLNIIEHFKALNKLVISATYFLKQGNETTLCISQYDDWTKKTGIQVNFHESLALMDGSIKEVGSTGIGCTMFKKEALMQIPFRHRQTKVGVKESYDSTTFSDTFFYLDCKRNGIPVEVDTSLLPEHDRINYDAPLKTLRL